MPTEDFEDTKKLLQNAASGDTAAVNALLSIHRDYLYRLVQSRLGDTLRERFDVSDVVQETQLEATRRLNEYLSDPSVSFRMWLRRTAIEQIITHHRKHVTAKRRSIYREQQVIDSTFLATDRVANSPSKLLRRRELTDRVLKEMQNLPQVDQEILQLRHVEELTNQEISELLSISPDTASQRYGRAVRRLVSRLESLGITSSEVD